MAWHILPNNWRLAYTGEKVKPGEWASVEGKLLLCINGLHASRKLADALGICRQLPEGYNPRLVVCKVQCQEIGPQDTKPPHCKFVCRRRRVVAFCDITRYIHRFTSTAWDGTKTHVKSLNYCHEKALSVIERYAKSHLRRVSLTRRRKK